MEQREIPERRPDGRRRPKAAAANGAAPPRLLPDRGPPAGGHASDIVSQIEDEILHGRLPPGSRLDERALAQRFGVSRTPVREAIHRLSASGLVNLGGRQGAQIVHLEVSDLLDGFFVLAELEGMAARLAARRIRGEEKDRLRVLHEACAARSAERDEAGFFVANNAFHSAIIVASRNRILQDQLRATRLLIAPYRYYATFRPGRMQSSIPEHEAIMDAIIAGDGAAAASIMATHVNLLGDHLSDTLHILREHTEKLGL